ncbi:ECF transporter S component [Abyssisolibacter fermentans]|uniref:ECF transporter S component n=1 Tax=Abyssisolibacter fermentans TaxID=1766203 RepID=UPI000829743F|nr:ECF transporter S component [Abyssisolibacter fermentans]
MKIEKNRWTTRRIVILALLAAFNLVATFINIPIGASMMHLGTTALFITALLLNPIDAAIASGGGMFLFDIIGGFVAYAPFTLIIKGAMAFVVSLIVHKYEGNGLRMKVNLFAYIIGGIVSLVGYYFTNVFFLGNFIAPLSKIPGSLLTTTVGIIIALPIGIQVKKAYMKLN